MPKASELMAAIRPSRDGLDFDGESVEYAFRSRRFVEVQRLIEGIIAERGVCRIVDLGGTERYWHVGERFLKDNRERISITLVNLRQESVAAGSVFTAHAGDATDPELLADEQFDLVHSNSVIEHVGTRVDMQRYADNVRRLASRYYVQTPNYWFLFEPHFRLPAFQYLPEKLRVAIIRNFEVGFFDKIKDRDKALHIIRHHQLVSAREVRRFFPDAQIKFEKLGPLTKSIMAIRG